MEPNPQSGTIKRSSRSWWGWTLVWVVLLGALLPSCQKADEYPIEPEIEHLGFKRVASSTGADSSLVLWFQFTDGDADVGLRSRDTAPPYEYNLYVSYEEKRDGQFQKVLVKLPQGGEDTVHFNGRIPLLNDKGFYNSIRAEVEHAMDLYFRGSDTVRFTYYMLDRALHKSNVISTGPVILRP